jgi:hypothetical protein
MGQNIAAFHQPGKRAGDSVTHAMLQVVRRE